MLNCVLRDQDNIAKKEIFLYAVLSKKEPKGLDWGRL